MIEDKAVITDRENNFLTTIIECRKQICEATMRIKEAKTELTKLAPHKVGEIVNIVVKGKNKNVGTMWKPNFVVLPDKQVEAVLTNIEAEVGSYENINLYYRYTFKPIKKDGGISQHAISPRGKDTVEWNGVIHKDYK